ncbi:MAG: hypothetical protein ACD_37C00356G0001, partial [uncultured bacterium]
MIQPTGPQSGGPLEARGGTPQSIDTLSL